MKINLEINSEDSESFVDAAIVLENTYASLYGESLIETYFNADVVDAQVQKMTAQEAFANNPTMDVPKPTQTAQEAFGTPTSPGEGNNTMLDAAGMPWDSRIHASTKTKTTKGLWKRRPKVDTELFKQVQAEHKQAMAASVPEVVEKTLPTAPPVIPDNPTAPEMPPIAPELPPLPPMTQPPTAPTTPTTPTAPTAPTTPTAPTAPVQETPKIITFPDVLLFVTGTVANNGEKGKRFQQLLNDNVLAKCNLQVVQQLATASQEVINYVYNEAVKLWNTLG